MEANIKGTVEPHIENSRGVVPDVGRDQIKNIRIFEKVITTGAYREIPETVDIYGIAIRFKIGADMNFTMGVRTS